MAAVFATAAIVVPITASPANAATEITFWSWRPEDKVFYEAQAAKFLAATGISVKFTPYVATEYNAILATALTAGSGPDVMQVRPYGGMSNLSDAGNFLALTTKDVPALAKMSAGTLAGVQGYASKKQYGLPYATSVIGVMYNPDLLKKAGVSSAPKTRTEFAAAAKAVSGLGGNVSGWVIPLSQTNPNGIQNDIMSLVWASGGSMLKSGKPNLTGNAEVKSVLTFVKGMWDAGSITPGAFTLAEPDKVTEFTNGRAGMMIDSLSHITQIKTATPDLNFSIHALPKADAYSGKGGIPYASWGIGISKDSKYPVQAAKLLAYLMSTPVNT